MEMWKELFRFPQHNEIAGICCLCNATPDSYKDFTSLARWRTNRLTHWDICHRIQAAGKTCCPS